MSMVVRASSTALVSGGADKGTNVSSAEQAYRDALKVLAEAQQTLAKHAFEGAGEEVLEADKAAVQVAAGAVAAAAAAVEAERAEARRQVEQRRDAARGGGDGPASRQMAMAAAVAAVATLDTYA